MTLSNIYTFFLQLIDTVNASSRSLATAKQKRRESADDVRTPHTIGTLSNEDGNVNGFY